MKYNQLGRSDLHVSAICLGSMTFGQQNTEAEAHAQLDYAFDQGINTVDSAEMYPVPAKAETCNRTEDYIGSWLKTKSRDKVIIATKIAGPARATKWIRGGPLAIDRANIREAVEGSLKRLRTDYIDLYQIHWPDRNLPLFGAGNYEASKERPSTPILEQLKALDELVREGKVRHIGISNEFPWGVSEFVKLAEQHGLARIASIQNAYSLLNRTLENGLTEICFRDQIGVLGYSPLAMGHLTGKYLAEPKAQGRITLFEGFGRRYEKPNVAPASAAYVALAKQHGLTSVQLALGFAASRWFMSGVIVGATSMQQLKENIAACATPIAPEVLAEIEDLQQRYTNPAP